MIHSLVLPEGYTDCLLFKGVGGYEAVLADPQTFKPAACSYVQLQGHTTSSAHRTSPCTSRCHLQAAVELCWLTCISSELNGAELTRSGGVLIMGRLLSRCCTILPPDVHATQPTAVVATHALRAFGGMAAFKHAREELAERSGCST